jgi:hypothetical protein
MMPRRSVQRAMLPIRREALDLHWMPWAQEYDSEEVREATRLLYACLDDPTLRAAARDAAWAAARARRGVGLRRGTRRGLRRGLRRGTRRGGGGGCGVGRGAAGAAAWEKSTIVSGQRLLRRRYHDHHAGVV